MSSRRRISETLTTPTPGRALERKDLTSLFAETTAGS